MIIHYLFDISHNLSISSLSLNGHMIHRLAIRLKHGRRLRMQDKGNR